MPECEGCGANINRGERQCPYCGHSQVKKTTTAIPGTKDPRVYEVDRATGTVRFGDGETGKRLPSGRDTGPERPLTGHEPTVEAVCPNCKRKNPFGRSECEACATPLKRPATGRLKR